MKKLLALLLCLLLITISVFIVSADNTSETEIELSIESKQRNSINSNNALINYFLESNTTKSKSEIYKFSDCYPDYYGGSYIDSNGELVILIKDTEACTTTELNTIMEITDAPKTIDCSYSYSELEDIVDEITLAVNNYNETNANYSGFVTCWAIDDKANNIVVYLKDLSETTINWFKLNICNANCIVFKQSEKALTYDANLSGQGIIAVTGSDMAQL